MHILVFVKQVPDASQVRVNYETGTLIREGVPAILNPFEEHAVEEAVRLKNEYGGKVTIITMGPPQASEALKQCLSRGADKAYLLSDRIFAGSDTLATSYALYEGARKIVDLEGDVDLFFAGKQAIDGDTAQTGPGIATRFNLPLITYLIKIDELNLEEKYVIATRLTEFGQETIKAPIPVFFTVEESLNILSHSPLPYLIKAEKAEIELLSGKNVPLDKEQCGLKHSPTMVKKAFTPEKRQRGATLSGTFDDVVSQTADKIAPFLKKVS
ncbi:MAG: protein FixA [bacterium]|nr:MAG: protein FixA [bacterium]